jgi:hypothetical protein
MLPRLLTFVPLILAAGMAGQAPAPRPNAFNVIERFERMPPEQRRRFLDRLPPERKQEFETRFARYRRMTPAQRQQVREQYELFQDLPKDRQDALRRSFRLLNELPADRRGLLRRECLELRRMPEPDRLARLNNDEFRGRYSASEQQLLGDLARLLPPPRPPAPEAASK